MWHAGSVPNVLIGVLAIGLAIVLQWYLRRARQQTSGEDRNADDGTQISETATSHHTPRFRLARTRTPDAGLRTDRQESHPGSVTRARADAEPCGTIEPVTPLPSPIMNSGTDVPAGSPGGPDGDTSRSEPDPALVAAVEVARAAAEEEAAPPGDEPLGSPVLPPPASTGESDDAVGAHVAVRAEGEHAATHYFESHYPGYVGWQWAVTVAMAGADAPVTVSEVVLLPGPDALTAPQWVPWNDRVRPGDLGAGDLLPSSPDDHRLVPGYLSGDSSELVGLAREVGFGRDRVLGPEGRRETAARWHDGEFGPDSETARMAPANCATCGFFVGLTGGFNGAFGVCANEMSPADGRVVAVEFGCGAHSEAEVDVSSTVPVAEVVYDDTTLDYEARSPERG